MMTTPPASEDIEPAGETLPDLAPRTTRALLQLCGVLRRIAEDSAAERESKSEEND